MKHVPEQLEVTIYKSKCLCSLFYWSSTLGLYVTSRYELTLQWRHNGRDSVSNHQPYDCFLNRLFRRRSKETSKLRVTGLCAGNSPGTGEFPHKWPVTRIMFPLDDVIMNETIFEMGAWISNDNHTQQMYVATHPSPSCNGVTKPPLKLWRHSHFTRRNNWFGHLTIS